MSVVDSVSTGESSSSSSEKAVSIRIPRKYPPAPEGMHRAICVTAEVKEVQEDTEFAKKGDKRIHFAWEIMGQSYKDEAGEERKYRVFSKPMTMMFKKGKGKTPNIVTLMMKLTGYPPFTQTVTVPVNIGNGVMKNFEGEEFDQKMVENMECNLVIQHEEWNGEMRANIETYATTDEQRKKNFDLLSPEARSAFKGMPMETLQPEPSKVEETISPVAPAGGYSSSVEQAKDKLKAMTTASEFQAFETIVLMDMNEQELAELQTEIDETRKRLGM